MDVSFEDGHGIEAKTLVGVVETTTGGERVNPSNAGIIVDKNDEVGAATNRWNGTGSPDVRVDEGKIR